MLPQWSAFLPTSSSTQYCTGKSVPAGFPAAKELMGLLFPAPYIPNKWLIWRFPKGKGSCQQKRKGLKWCNWPFLSWLKPATGWATQFRSGGRYSSGFLRGRRLRSAELSLCMWAACFEQYFPRRMKLLMRVLKKAMLVKAVADRISHLKAV